MVRDIDALPAVFPAGELLKDAGQRAMSSRRRAGLSVSPNGVI
jgi:hypothetical protein